MGVLENIQKGRYENKGAYPVQRNFRIYKTCEHCGSTYLDVKEKKRYTVAKLKYRHDNAEMIKKLKQDIIEEAGVVDNPKANDLWDIAWDQGHSSGLNEVYNYFFDYLKIIL